MKEYGDEHLPNGADIGVMNVHGHRATMPKGTVTIGNIFEIYSFDNTITFLDLKGSDLKKMFDAYARIGGAGISSNVKLVIEDRKVKSVTVDNKPIDNDKIYKIVTLDYLAEGNDNMNAFLNAISINNTGVTLRDIMIDWVKEQTRMGNEIESAIDGRIIIIE
jgi:2',3'-cyclic-nucleotide 2'-phosphodiesterase (5'-nucleotidase family)